MTLNRFLVLIAVLLFCPNAQSQVTAIRGGTPALCRWSSDNAHTRILAPKSLFQVDPTAVFEVTYDGFPNQAKIALEYALSIYSRLLISSVPIRIKASYITEVPSELAGFAAAAAPDLARDFPGAPVPGLLFPIPLAESISGQNLNGDRFDFYILVNGRFNYNYKTDGIPITSQIDFVTLLLHEITHGLGFFSAGVYDNVVAGFGLYRETNPTLLKYVPAPDPDGPVIFDLYMMNHLSKKILEYLGSSSDLVREFTSGNLYFDGEQARRYNYGDITLLYAPKRFAIGSSLSHVDQTKYPPGDINALMKPIASAAEVLHHPGPIVLGVLKDLGWTLNPAAKTHPPMIPVPALYEKNNVLAVGLWSARSEFAGAVTADLRDDQETVYIQDSGDIGGWNPGTEFRYKTVLFQYGTGQDTPGWQSREFDDSHWAFSSTGFTLGHSSPQTNPETLLDDSAKTTYIRCTFDAVNYSAIEEMTLRIEASAVAVAWLNGTFIRSAGVRNGEKGENPEDFQWNTYANSPNGLSTTALVASYRYGTRTTFPVDRIDDDPTAVAEWNLF